jgi:hypothetical protein
MSAPRHAAALAAILALAACGSDGAYDEATAALAARIEAAPANAALRDAVAARRASEGDAAASAREIAARFAELGVVPLRVPGLYYESHPQSGADLTAVERWLDRPVPMAPCDEVGAVGDNASVVAIAIRELAKDGRRVAVFSASKGSADVREALETQPDLAPRIALWIDLAGVLEGTPLTEPGSAAREASAEWLPEATADSMSETVRRAVQAKRTFPPGVRVVHVAAFPRVSEVTPPIRAPWRLLRGRGPTDGYVLLESYLRAPGRVLILRGTDHYLRDPRLPATVAAAILVALDETASEAGQP